MNKDVFRNAVLVAAVVVVCSAVPAFASSSGMPWETPLNSLLDSLTGPVSEYSGESVPPIPGESVPGIPRYNVPPIPGQSVPPF